MKRAWIRFLQVGATLLVTWFIVDRIGVTWADLADLGERWRRPELFVLSGASALLLAGYAISAALWRNMVAELGGGRLGLRRAAEIYFVSNLGRYVPGKVWQLASLAYLAGRSGVAMETATAAAVLLQILSLGGAAVVGAWMFVARPGVTGGWGAVGAVCVVAVAVVATLPPVLQRGLRLWARLLGRETDGGRGDAGRDGVRSDVGRGGVGGEFGGEDAHPGGVAASVPVLSDRSGAFGVRWLALFTFNWVVYGLAFAVMAHSFGVSAPPAVLGSAFAAAYVLGYLMIFAPAGIGVREGFLIAFLQPSVGVPAATAAAVIARFWMTFVELLPGMAFAGSAARHAGTEEGKG